MVKFSIILLAFCALPVNCIRMVVDPDDGIDTKFCSGLRNLSTSNLIDIVELHSAQSNLPEVSTQTIIDYLGGGDVQNLPGNFGALLIAEVRERFGSMRSDMSATEFVDIIRLYDVYASTSQTSDGAFLLEKLDASLDDRIRIMRSSYDAASQIRPSDEEADEHHQSSATMRLDIAEEAFTIGDALPPSSNRDQFVSFGNEILSAMTEEAVKIHAEANLLGGELNKNYEQNLKKLKM